MTGKDFRDFVLNCNVPSVVKNLKLNWSFFDKSFTEFANEFGEKKLIFDQGFVKSSKPQFENHRLKKPLNLKEFLQISEEDKDHWYCYNYKYIRDLPEKFKNDISFKELGFDELEQDTSLWIGSKNSHTACHQDSYGVNIVVQVYGKKSWLLFPPNSKNKASRVPYEESSIYSAENFYCPNSYKEFLGLENDAFHVILEPGDILIVPRKWWHFVKVVETSLNFNWWIKLEDDQESQIDECITKILIKKLLGDCNQDLINICINHNEIDSFYNDGIDYLYNTLQYLIELKLANKKLKLCKTYKCHYLSDQEFQNLEKKLVNFLNPVETLKDYEFFAIIIENIRNYVKGPREITADPDIALKIKLINQICEKNCVNLIKNCILKNYEK